MQKRIQWNKKYDTQRSAEDHERNQQDAQSRRLHFPCLLDLSTVVVDGHLHIRKSLQAVIKRSQISYRRAQRQPLAVKAYAIGMKKGRRQQQLGNNRHQLSGILGCEKLSDAT